MDNCHTVYQGETFAMNKAGIHIQKLSFCIQQTLFTFDMLQIDFKCFLYQNIWVFTENMLLI